MTLTLDEVKRMRFRLTQNRRTGYEVTDVDKFVDRVEETFTQLLQENELLKKQLDALSEPGQEVSDQGSVRIAELESEIKDLRSQLAQQASEGGEASDQTGILHKEINDLRAQLQKAKDEATKAKQNISAPAAFQGNGEHIVVTTSADASPAVVRLVELATAQAEQVVSEAYDESKRKIEEANQKAFEITSDARTKADRIESEARVDAESVTTEANNRAAKVDAEVADRRRELFNALETERDDLRKKVSTLNEYEEKYRTNLFSLLEQQLKQLKNTEIAPAETPEILTESDESPRLNALMKE